MERSGGYFFNGGQNFKHARSGPADMALAQSRSSERQICVNCFEASAVRKLAETRSVYLNGRNSLKGFRARGKL